VDQPGRQSGRRDGRHRDAADLDPAEAAAAGVGISDTGHLMPPLVAARAFDVFFMTKGVGAGTGLGLDIARRIVTERHGGAITIDSRPGHTVLSVRLPIHQPPG
jgi:signal transduction histidine kinase